MRGCDTHPEDVEMHRWILAGVLCCWELYVSESRCLAEGLWEQRVRSGPHYTVHDARLLRQHSELIEGCTEEGPFGTASCAADTMKPARTPVNDTMKQFCYPTPSWRTRITYSEDPILHVT